MNETGRYFRGYGDSICEPVRDGCRINRKLGRQERLGSVEGLDSRGIETETAGRGGLEHRVFGLRTHHGRSLRLAIVSEQIGLAKNGIKTYPRAYAILE